MPGSETSIFFVGLGRPAGPATAAPLLHCVFRIPFRCGQIALGTTAVWAPLLWLPKLSGPAGTVNSLVDGAAGRDFFYAGRTRVWYAGMGK